VEIPIVLLASDGNAHHGCPQKGVLLEGKNFRGARAYVRERRFFSSFFFGWIDDCARTMTLSAPAAAEKSAPAVQGQRANSRAARMRKLPCSTRIASRQKPLMKTLGILRGFSWAVNGDAVERTGQLVSGISRAGRRAPITNDPPAMPLRATMTLCSNLKDHDAKARKCSYHHPTQPPSCEGLNLGHCRLPSWAL